MLCNFGMEKKQMLVTSQLQGISRTLNDPVFKVCCFPLALKTKSTHSSFPKHANLKEARTLKLMYKENHLFVYGPMCIFNEYSDSQTKSRMSQCLCGK